MTRQSEENREAFAGTFREWLDRGRKMLHESGVTDAETDAWLLMEAVAGMSRQDYLLRGKEQMSAKEAGLYEQFLKKRQDRIPVQYILQEAWLCGHSFFVTDDVLIPRMDTETLVSEAVKRLENGMKILDLCTGSGCILLSLLSGRDLDGYGSDISEAALRVAESNRRRLGLAATWICSDMFRNIDDTYDMIVSNPPYIASGDIAGLEPEVRCHEPLMALDGGKDGMDFLRVIITEAPGYLRNGGWLLMEIGYDQGEQAEALLRENGYIRTEIIKDLSGCDRVAVGRKADV